MLVELARIFLLTFDIVILYKFPILQSIINLFVLLIYDFNLVRYCKHFLFINKLIVPNKTWYINIFLIANEICVTSIFGTAVIFAYLDKMSYSSIFIKNIKKTIKI